MDTSVFNIRAINCSDFDEWSRLWKSYLTFYNTDLPSQIHQVAFERLISDDDSEFNGLIAERNGQPVGIAHYLFHRDLWKIEKVCYLQDLFVNPESRGLGVGRALIEAVYTKADEAGSPHVYWCTQEFNHEARKLYDRVGHHTPFIVYER